MKEKSIYEQIQKLNIPFSNHESDLQCIVTKETTNIINNYRFKCNVTKFICESDDYKGTLWYDIPFAYDPFWNNKILFK